ncbi:hypothetical protein D9M68_883840 [compost metagenome]
MVVALRWRYIAVTASEVLAAGVADHPAGNLREFVAAFVAICAAGLRAVEEARSAAGIALEGAAFLVGVAVKGAEAVPELVAVAPVNRCRGARFIWERSHHFFAAIVD